MDISYYKLVLDHFNVFLACFQKEVHWTPLDHIRGRIGGEGPELYFSVNTAFR